MIYKIYGNQITSALVDGAKFIIFSFDGQYALVRSDSPLTNALEQYEETQMDSLYADPLYRQPCKDC
jgi:hypothetical protein